MIAAADSAPPTTALDRAGVDKRTSSDRRRKVFQVVQIDRSGTMVRGHLLNISSAGALLHSQAALTTGARIELGTGNGTRAALILWHAGQYFGVRFVEALAPTVVQDIIECKETGTGREHSR